MAKTPIESGAQATASGAEPSDRHIAAKTWPLWVACALGLVPFTIYSNFLVEITQESGASAALMGGLRGIGGVAALIVGFTCAPLLDRVSRRAAVGASLAVLALACVVALVATAWAWVLFCLVVGAATSVLNPAASALAADLFHDEATAGRAATQVSSVMTLTAVLSAPLLAAPAMLWGWQGDFIAAAILCIMLAALVASPWTSLASSSSAPPEAPSGKPRGYLASWRIAGQLRGVLPMLIASAARTSAFMGQLAYLAVFYHERFNLGPGIFSLVWTLSGSAFFVGNWFGGKALRSVRDLRQSALIGCVAAVAATLAVGGLFMAPTALWALCATATLGASHAVLAASVTVILVGQSSGHRGTILGLNGAGQSLGVCIGASIAGLGLALGGWHGVGLVLAVTTAVAIGAAAFTAVRLRPAQHSALNASSTGDDS
ncbi:MFS transporter [uncultured Kocuria sp.]|uniref:MFS transporter n=1 Tax=uncultured Kocuria sp. TaxID=259305 RepID=UPI002598FD6E|nr:MFS transporter [uncultured Kocuria sp.]MCT1367988.1 MFS transporter [Rothia sp. p3-SID1597]